MECPVFYPTIEDFNKFDEYIAKLESKIGGDAGVCKIIPPKSWFLFDSSKITQRIDSLIIKNAVKVYVPIVLCQISIYHRYKCL